MLTYLEITKVDHYNPLDKKIHISKDMPMKIQYSMDTFMDMDDDDEGLEDSPIGRRKGGHLKRRRTSKGGDEN